MVIIKALYGLRSSGARWHDRLYDALSGMGFKPSKADPDIWMRDRGDHYEYVAVYVTTTYDWARTVYGEVKEQSHRTRPNHEASTLC